MATSGPGLPPATGSAARSRPPPAALGLAGLSSYLPTQHQPRHLSHPEDVQFGDTERLGSFTAPTADTYQISCANSTSSHAGPLDVRAQQHPSGWVQTTLYIAIGLTLAALVCVVIMVGLRTRSRLLRTVIDAGGDFISG
jgi:hypothetical protein